MKKSAMFRLLLALCLPFFLCSCLSDAMSELRGTARPRADTSIAQAPENKTYKAPQSKIVEAVKSCFKKDGLLTTCSNSDSKTVRVTAEEVNVQQASFIGSMMGGSSYYASQIVDVASDGTVTFYARFVKLFGNPPVRTENQKFPEKENELRAKFFAALDGEM